MEHTDVCFAPVLTMAEAAEHPHNVARETIVERDGVKQPAPAPRFSRTTPEIARRRQHAGQDTREVLADWGFAEGPHRRARRGRAVASCERRRSGSGRTASRITDATRRDAVGHGASCSSTPIPTTRPAATGGSMARAAAEGHRVVLVVCTERRARRGARRPRPTARRSSTGGATETRASAGDARRRPRRLARLPRLGDDRLGAERRPGVVLAGRRRRGRRSGWPRSSARSTPTSS